MSNRPTTGRPRRGPSGKAHPATEATELPPEELEPVARPPSRASRRAETRFEQPASGNTRIMSADDVEGAEPSEPEDAEATHAGPPISVEVLEGPDAGKKKAVRGGRMVIGRGDGCDLKLRDTACSRRHLELIVGFSGAVVRDLGSGNGTKVNGERVEEVAVGHGDEVQVGTTLIRIVDELAELDARRKPAVEEPPHVEPADLDPNGADDEPGAPPATQMRPAVRAPSTAAVDLPLGAGINRKWVLAGVGAVTLVAVLVGALVLGQKPKLPPPPKLDANRVAEVLKEGKSALVAGDFEKANADWDELEKLDKTNGDLPELRARTVTEKDARAKLDAASAALADHRYDDARIALGAVPPAALCFDKAAALLKTLDAQQTIYLAGLGAQKVAANDLDGARQVVPQLERLDPAGADTLTRAIETAESQQEAAELANVKSARQRARMLRELKRRKAEQAVRNELESGYRKFHEATTPGGYSRAATEFERIAEQTRNKTAASRARGLVGKVRDFAKALGDANALEADKSYQAEIAPLDRAVSALAHIDSGSPMMPRLKLRLVRGLVLEGHGAAARQDYDLAARAYRKALQLEPSDVQAKAGMSALHSRANDVYLQAYEEENRDPESARKLYQAVLKMVGPDEELHDKAKHRIETMDAH